MSLLEISAIVVFYSHVSQMYASHWLISRIMAGAMTSVTFVYVINVGFAIDYKYIKQQERQHMDEKETLRSRVAPLVHSKMRP